MKIFLDHNSTTPLLPAAFESMKPYLTTLFYNPGGIQEACQKINLDIEDARKVLCRLISKKPGNLMFTSSATESNNFVLSQQNFTKIVTTRIEHPSVLSPALFHHKDAVCFVNLKQDGTVDFESLENELEKNTGKNNKVLVSIQYANQVIHTIQPMKEISLLCRKYGAYLHVDATQAFGKMPMNDLDADFITISAHKCYGPKGIAALWISDTVQNEFLIPLLLGGHQESGLRAGTHNAAGIIGFKTAAEYMYSHLKEHDEKIKRLTSIFYQNFMSALSDSTLNGSESCRLNGGLHFSVPNADMRSILLSVPDLIISTGMSCSNGESDPVLKALGKIDSTRNSFRLQIGFENTEDEINQAVQILTNTIVKSRNFWGNF